MINADVWSTSRVHEQSTERDYVSGCKVNQPADCFLILVKRLHGMKRSMSYIRNSTLEGVSRRWRRCMAYLDPWCVDVIRISKNEIQRSFERPNYDKPLHICVKSHYWYYVTYQWEGGVTLMVFLEGINFSLQYALISFRCMYIHVFRLNVITSKHSQNHAKPYNVLHRHVGRTPSSH